MWARSAGAEVSPRGRGGARPEDWEGTMGPDCWDNCAESVPSAARPIEWDNSECECVGYIHVCVHAPV